MARSKVPLLLRDEFTSTTSEQSAGEVKVIDISAYVDPLAGKVLKINNVSILVDNGAGLPLDDSDITEYNPIAQVITGTQTAVKATSDERCIYSKMFYFGKVVDQTASSTWTDHGLRVFYDEMQVPSMGYYVATDAITLVQKSQTDAIASVRFMFIIEAERVKLTAADVNFLLVNQTYSG
jgi:hypothetical protein